MKIFLKPNSIKSENYNMIIKRFPEVEFVSEEESSYDADAIIVFPNFVTEDNIDKYSKLKWIQLLTAGFDTINLEFLKKRDIVITNAKGVYSITIAEDVFAKILTINRNIKHYLNNMEDGKWEALRNEPEIYGSTVGIIGVGSIAKEIAKRMLAFGAKVIGYRRKKASEEYFKEIFVGEEGLEELLKQSDYVVLALPLNEESRDLIDKSKLSFMKETAVLINIARGEIVVQEDLIDALKNKKIRAAGLDVTNPEPLPADNELWKLENVFITPHNSVSSPMLFNRLAILIEENIYNFVQNKSLINKVNS